MNKLKRAKLVVLAAICLLALTASSCSAPSPENPKIELKDALIMLKEENTKPLVGFALGDGIDNTRVEKKGGYFRGGEIYILTGGINDDLFLFFSGEGNSFSGLAVNSGDFFGIALCRDEPQKVFDILGEPDVYELDDVMDEGLFALYYFEKMSLYFMIDADNKIWEINYKIR